MLGNGGGWIVNGERKKGSEGERGARGRRGGELPGKFEMLESNVKERNRQKID